MGLVAADKVPVLVQAGFRNPGYEIILKLAPHTVNASWEGTSESREMYDTSGNSIGPYSKSHGMHAWACVAVRELVLEGLVSRSSKSSVASAKRLSAYSETYEITVTNSTTSTSTTAHLTSSRERSARTSLMSTLSTTPSWVFIAHTYLLLCHRHGVFSCDFYGAPRTF